MSESEQETPARKRPRPGERRLQILQTLANMLEQPGAERITTAALAARVGVSEAALYRHFASKAQMFEGLIDFIEQSVFGLVQQITQRETDPRQCVTRLVTMLLQFGEKNPGMVRVMVGDALVFENERLQQRMNLLFDKIDAALRQCLARRRRGRRGLRHGHPHARRPGPGLAAHGLPGRAPAALRPFGFSPRAVRAPGREPRAHPLTLPKKNSGDKQE